MSHDIIEAHQQALAGFAPFTGSESQEKLLERWTKYNRADDDIYNVTWSGTDTSFVLVRRPDKGTLAVVARELREKVELGEGKTAYRYNITMLRPVQSVEDGAEVLRDLRLADEAKTASEIEGFGDVAVDPEDDPADGVGF